MTDAAQHKKTNDFYRATWNFKRQLEHALPAAENMTDRLATNDTASLYVFETNMYSFETNLYHFYSFLLEHIILLLDLN